MIYFSIDIETTGLDAKSNDTLEIGCIIEDTSKKLPREQCPTFHVYVDKPNYRGNAFALALNANILKKIAELQKAEDKTLLCPEAEVATRFKKFAIENNVQKTILAAGKNFGTFDKLFLNELPTFAELIRFHHRQLDPTMYFVDYNQLVPPDLATCKKLAGLPELVTHQALDDAWDVIELLRTKY